MSVLSDVAEQTAKFRLAARLSKFFFGAEAC